LSDKKKGGSDVSSLWGKRIMPRERGEEGEHRESLAVIVRTRGKKETSPHLFDVEKEEKN